MGKEKLLVSVGSRCPGAMRRISRYDEPLFIFLNTALGLISCARYIYDFRECTEPTGLIRVWSGQESGNDI